MEILSNTSRYTSEGILAWLTLVSRVLSPSVQRLWREQFKIRVHQGGPELLGIVKWEAEGTSWTYDLYLGDAVQLHIITSALLEGNSRAMDPVLQHMDHLPLKPLEEQPCE